MNWIRSYLALARFFFLLVAEKEIYIILQTEE